MGDAKQLPTQPVARTREDMKPASAEAQSDKSPYKTHTWQEIAFVATLSAGVGFGLGGFAIKYFKNRGLDVYEIAVGKVERNPMAIKHLGKPIKTAGKDYKGTVSQQVARFSFDCHGPKGKGTVKANATRHKNKDGDFSDWKFSHLGLDVKGQSKNIDLLKQM